MQRRIHKSEMISSSWSYLIYLLVAVVFLFYSFTATVTMGIDFPPSKLVGDTIQINLADYTKESWTVQERENAALVVDFIQHLMN